MQSVDLKVKEAVMKIQELETEEDIWTFTKGDNRETVLNASEKRIKELRGKKKGEVKEITQRADDFKEGIQKTKNYVTCEDVLKNLREKGYKV